jgi:NTE family protein
LFYNYKLYAMYDSRNSSVLHTRGSRFYAGVKLITDNFVTYKKTVPLVTAMIKNEAAVKVSNKFTFLHGQASRVFLTSAMPHTLLLTFTGGDYKPDFYEYSLPFYGLRFLEVISKNSLVLMSGLRYQIYKRHYLTLYTNLAAVNNALVAVSSFKLIAGTGLGYTYNSFLGPMQYTLSYSNASKTLIAYVSLGFKF